MFSYKTKIEVNYKYMYSLIIIFLESLKHRYRSKNKLIRAINYFKYLFIVNIENFVVRHYSTFFLSLNGRQRDKRIVVSLTTYPGRINECYYTLKTIFAQTIKPDRIVLWLAESQFPDHILPKQFNKLIDKGLEIRYCEDLRSHKKYFYMLQEQKDNELVITFDDDIIYHPNTIKRAIKQHLKYPFSIVCNEAKVITLDVDKKSLSSYNSWVKASDGSKEPDIYKYSILTGSGCLYPYGIMPKETFNIDNIKNLAFTADDLWITFIAKQFEIKVAPTDIMAKPYTTIINSQTSHLAQVNCLGSGNDDAIRRLLDVYPLMKDKLLNKLL